MRRSPTRAAFSLVEVVIAVGVLAVAVAGVLVLLPGLTREVADMSDEMTAQRFPGAVHSELARAAGGGSLAGLAARLGGFDAGTTLRLVATHDGRTVQLAEDTSLVPAEQYFLIEVRAFAAAPLAFDTGAGAVLPAWVNVSWPYRRPDPAGGEAIETAAADRAVFSFAVALNR